MSIAPKAKISIGDFKHILEIQRTTTSVDEEGFQKESWETIAKPRCKVEFDDRLMREIFKDNGIDTTAVKIFTIRYIKGLSYQDRILYQGQSYEIYGMNNIDEQTRFIKIWARGIVD